MMSLQGPGERGVKPGCFNEGLRSLFLFVVNVLER